MELLEIVPRINLNVIEETLSRIGVADHKNKILYPSCILYKDLDGKYFLAHFKELFMLRKSKPSFYNMSEEDILRRNSIGILLEDWDMIDILNLEEDVETVFVYALPHSKKFEWTIKHKFNMRTL